MAEPAILLRPRSAGTIGGVGDTDEEATQLMLEAIFDIRRKVTDIHEDIFGPKEDDDEQEEEDS